jgi:hypothetical protein
LVNIKPFKKGFDYVCFLQGVHWQVKSRDFSLIGQTSLPSGLDVGQILPLHAVKQGTMGQQRRELRRMANRSAASVMYLERQTPLTLLHALFLLLQGEQLLTVLLQDLILRVPIFDFEPQAIFCYILTQQKN